ncbi:transposase domain-containing protein [Streptomyces sp. NPDC101150]|uniref:transposase domain-containing protein n=1 Tax=Streptomyces sp. NPDC101150 TaxID=3366114 RepID=UPI00381A24D1
MHPWNGVSEDVRLGVPTEWVTPELVDDVLAHCGRGGVKPGDLSPKFMTYFTLAPAQFAQDSYADVADNLVGALEGMSATISHRASFTRARQRLGPIGGG